MNDELTPIERQDEISIPSEEAWKQLDDFEKERVKRINEAINSRLRQDVYWGWQVGEWVAEIYKHGRDKARHRLQLVAAALGLKTDRPLYTALQVVERWETKERFSALVEAATYNGRTLPFSHLVVLSQIIDDEEAFEYAKEASKAGYDYRTLRALILGDDDRKPRGPGRLPNVPSSVEQCLPSMAREMVAFKNRLEHSWLSDDFNLVEELGQMPEITDNMETRLKEILENARLINEYLDQLISGLEDVLGE